MPNYEYKCTQDGSRFEVWQEVGAEAPPCPDCGALTKKVFQPPRVIFKGSGFYLTDLRAEQSGGAGSGEAGKPGSSASAEKSEPKAEKTEAKPEAAPAASGTKPNAS